MWLAVHLVYIIGFKSRVATFLHWVVCFLGRGRPERTSTEQQIFARHRHPAARRGLHPVDHEPRGQEGAGPVGDPGP